MTIPSDELRTLAMEAMRPALKDHEFSEEVEKVLSLTMVIRDDKRLFQLLALGDRPQDATVICQVEVDASTGECEAVEVLVGPEEPVSAAPLFLMNLGEEVPPDTRYYMPKEEALKQLKNLTGEDFGYDVEEWRQWFGNNQSASHGPE